MLSKKNLQKTKKTKKTHIAITTTPACSIHETSDSKYCDQCASLKLLPDPDPYDWFRDGNMKAICLEVNAVIAKALETPSEYTNINKPLFCPKLGHKLNKKEKKEAEKQLLRAKARI